MKLSKVGGALYVQGRIQDFSQGALPSFDPRVGPEPNICSKLPEILHDFEKNLGGPLDPLVM